MAKPTRVIKPEDPAYAGQKKYAPWFLKIYNPLVLGFFGPMVWRCPTGRLLFKDLPIGMLPTAVDGVTWSGIQIN